MTSPLINKDARGIKFFWNIGAKVGAKAPNKLVDVQLVQLGYHCMVRSPVNAGRLTSAEAEAFANIKPGPGCTGAEGDPLVRAIRAHEASRGGTQDGFVSQLAQGHIAYVSTSGKLALILVALNNSIKDILGDKYPRIDLHPACPGDLKAVAEACFNK